MALTYEPIDTIKNAFLEVGALFDAETYLLSSVIKGSILYIRLLIKLLTTSNAPIHQNWLAFISHLLRISAVGKVYRRYSPNHSLDLKAKAKHTQMILPT